MSTGNSYDLVPYRTKPRRMTHPETYASLATLLGLSPPKVETCRVLEIGCGTGGNLIAMAWALPNATFLGIDPSGVQIDIAREEAARFGLKNCHFEAIGVGELKTQSGPFDYIVCHGVFAWVPPAVQDEILECCRTHLSPHGAAMISYNTYPGWHLRGISREAMNFFTEGETNPELKIAKARSYLKFLNDAMPDKNSTIARVFKEEKEILDNADDFYIFHEHLEETNAPCYFREFAKRAAAHGMQYLGDAGRHWQMTGLSEETQKILLHISKDVIDIEQHLDFLRNRAFRHTLLVRAEAPVNRDVSLPAGMLVRTACRTEPVGKPLQWRESTTYESLEGVSMTTESPLMNAILEALIDCFPTAMPVADLQAKVRAKFAALPEDREEAVRLVPNAVKQLSTGGFVTLHVWQAEFVTAVSAKPVAWPIARHVAKSIRVVPTLTHQSINVSPLEGLLLAHCDGEHDLDDFVKLAAQHDLPATVDAVMEALVRLSTCAVLIR